MKSPVNTKGFTLIELLIVIVVITLLGGMVLSLQYIISRSQTSAWSNFLNVDASSSAVTGLTRELRNAKSGDNGSYPLVTANDQEIIFFSDYDFDGKTERIRYTLSGTNLIRGVIEPTDPPITYPTASEIVSTLTSYVRNGTAPVFYYYNSDYPQVTSGNPIPQALRISNTRLVRIILTVNTKDNDPRGNYTVEDNAMLRILKDN